MSGRANREYRRLEMESGSGSGVYRFDSPSAMMSWINGLVDEWLDVGGWSAVTFVQE